MLEGKEDFFSAGSFNAHPVVTLIWKYRVFQKNLWSRVVSG